MAKVRFRIDLWEFNLIFYNDVKQAEIEQGIELDEISTFTFDEYNTVLIVVDGCECKNISNENLRYLVHETGHAAMRILERIGVNFSFNDQEAFCYTQDFIFSQIVNRLNKLKLKT